MYIFNCPICNKTVTTSEKNKKYCSMECYKVDKPKLTTKENVKFVCKGCGKVKMVKPHIVKMRTFCSIKCASKHLPIQGEKNPNWKGGYLGKNGYLYIKQNGKYRLKHVVIYEGFHNIKVPKEFCVHHIDKNRANNNINNLKMMTRSLHQSLHSSKLTYEQVRELFNMYATGNYSHAQLGDMFNIDKSNISRILSGKRIYCGARKFCTDSIYKWNPEAGEGE